MQGSRSADFSSVKHCKHCRPRVTLPLQPLSKYKPIIATSLLTHWCKHFPSQSSAFKACHDRFEKLASLLHGFLVSQSCTKRSKTVWKNQTNIHSSPFCVTAASTLVCMHKSVTLAALHHKILRRAIDICYFMHPRRWAQIQSRSSVRCSTRVNCKSIGYKSVYMYILYCKMPLKTCRLPYGHAHKYALKEEQGRNDLH